MNLFIFSMGRLRVGAAPVLGVDDAANPADFADPVPQALILTSIVLGFAILAFAMVLTKRAYQTVGTDDLDAMRSTDE